MSGYKLEDRPVYLNPYLEKGFMAEKLNEMMETKYFARSIIDPPDERMKET